MLENNLLFDVIVTNGSHSISAHKLVLCAHSRLFESLIATSPSKKPTIMLPGISAEDLKAAIDFMYFGEVTLKQSQVKSFFTVCNQLQITAFENVDINELFVGKCEAGNSILTVADQNEVPSSVQNATDILAPSTGKEGDSKKTGVNHIQFINYSVDNGVEKPKTSNFQISEGKIRKTIELDICQDLSEMNFPVIQTRKSKKF
ncbi:Broad-complex core protein-like isoform 6 [Leptotrombidium deliense]|uniref:Broad-complex core protein-like isoform 6 n=1 Tax=Leptotrombidium deliense TaxID=299467 RepID=A0A443SHW8_9ACAR|nr:Broad-complex core protein-like isoform 6 [Leptotrombidium deliense]